MIKVGAHVSTADALHKCVERCCAIDAEALQIFASAPQSWRAVSHTAEAVATLRRHTGERTLAPLFVHGIYLVNLAAESEEHVQRSVASLARALQFCEEAGGSGVIFHLGSHKGAGFEAVLERVVQALRAALDAAPGESWLVIENSAGAGNNIGGRLAEIGTLLREASSDRLKVCLDTCHSFASGYDVRSMAGVEAMMEEFEREIGCEQLVAVHANDSKGALGEGKDRHENIGAGQIGLDGFRALMAHPAFAHQPFLLEVPGLTGKGPDKENVATLKQLRAEIFG